jgi:hypothetical protein
MLQRVVLKKPLIRFLLEYFKSIKPNGSRSRSFEYFAYQRSDEVRQNIERLRFQAQLLKIGR